MAGLRIKIGNGKSVNFWEDRWLEIIPEFIVSVVFETEDKQDTHVQAILKNNGFRCRLT